MHDLLTRSVVALFVIAVANVAVGEIVVLPKLRRRGFRWVFHEHWWADRAIRICWHMGSVGLCASAALLAELRMTASSMRAAWWTIAALTSAMPVMIVSSYVGGAIRSKLSSRELLAWRALWVAIFCAILLWLARS